jgi:IS30 family transposase
MHWSEVITDCSRFGHWECDLVMFCEEFGKANVTSLVERVSRFAVVLKTQAGNLNLRRRT